MDPAVFLNIEPTRFVAIVMLLALWTLPWKGYALWHAAKLSHKWWFIALLVVNTLAILEIIYIFAVVRRTQRGQGKQT